MFRFYNLFKSSVSNIILEFLINISVTNCTTEQNLTEMNSYITY